MCQISVFVTVHWVFQREALLRLRQRGEGIQRRGASGPHLWQTCGRLHGTCTAAFHTQFCRRRVLLWLANCCDLRTLVSAFVLQLKGEDEDAYKRQFGRFIKEGVTSAGIEAMYKNAHASIRKNPEHKAAPAKKVEKKR